MKGLAAAAVALAVVAVISDSAGAAARRPNDVSAAALAKALVAGQPVVEDRAVVHGDIDLKHAGKVGNVFVCNSCTFMGRIIARHVEFERGIDLSGSSFRKNVDLEGARFREPALFGPAEAGRQTGFHERVDFAFATFDDLAVFRGTTFEKTADFTSAHFGSVARFGDITFGDAALFGEAIFARDASFSRVSFGKRASFDGAAFGGVSDFRQAGFAGPAGFEETVFRGRAEFGRAALLGETSFVDARFASDALFVGSEFGKGDPALSFDHAGVGDKLDLDEARLAGSVDFRHAVVRSLSLDAIAYDDSSKIYVDSLAAGEASVDLHDAPHISGSAEEQQKILADAETTAKSQGDLRLANDLHYRRQVLASHGDSWPRRIVDIALYRYVAGYFVRPFRPLLWLLGLVFLITILRVAQTDPPKPPENLPPPPPPEGIDRFVQKLAYTVIPHAPEENPPSPLRRVELTVYAVLLACFVLALANTNPSLRDMVDALI
jgi:Pentapeptide repeats (9 copies)